MKRLYLLFTLLMASLIANASQNDSLLIVNLQKEVAGIKSDIQRQAVIIERNRQEITRLNQNLEKQGENIIKVQNGLNDAGQQAQRIEANMDSLAVKVGDDIMATDVKIDQSDQALSKRIQSRTWVAIVGIVFAIALLLASFAILRKRIDKGASTIDKIKSAQDELEKAQKALQEESVQLDNKLVELLDKQVTTQSDNGGQPDHSLALKVADEIVRIEMNLSHMDESVKGYKQLKKAVERIRMNFLANGYEIVEMLGMPYNEGMKVVANFVSDDTLAEGEQKITGIIKPQINYQGKMIQSAQITVSQNI